MHWAVKTVKPLPEYRLYVEIEDGRRGILYGAVTWPHEQDIPPETLLVEMAPVQEAPLCR